MSSSTPLTHGHAGDDALLVERFDQLRTSTTRELQDVPDGLLVQILRHATQYVLAVDPDSNTRTRLRGVSRITLRNVCRRWKNLIESIVCITLPDELGDVAFEVASLRRATNQLNTLGVLPGPVSIVIGFDRELFEQLSKQGGLVEIDEFARALAAPHKATLSVTFQDVPLDLVQRILANGGSRIVNLAITPSSIPAPVLPADPAGWTVTIPTFPHLSRIQLDCSNLSRPQVESFRSDSWAWLFQPAVCQQLLSVKLLYAQAGDVPWVLAQCPELVDLSISSLFEYPPPKAPTRYDVAHPNVNRLSIHGRVDFAIACPSLTTYSVGHPHPSLLPVSWPNITSITIPLPDLTPLEAQSLLQSLPQVSHLCLTNTFYQLLETVAEILTDETILPSLHTLRIEYFDNVDDDDGESFFVAPDLVTVAHVLHRILSPRPGGGSRMEVLDFRLAMADGPEPRFELWQLMLNLEYGRSLVEGGPAPSAASFDRPFDTWLQGIEQYLDQELENPNPDLGQLSELWTEFVTSNTEIDHVVFRNEWWIDLSTLWVVVDRLRAVFEGTVYPIHDEILDCWKRRLGSATKGWMMSIGVPDAFRQQSVCEGVFYGRRTGSLMYDLRREDYVALLTEGLFVLDHDVSTIFDHPPESLLKRIQLLPDF